MSETKSRKVHQPDFKAKVGLEAIRGIKTVNEIGQEFGAHPNVGESMEKGDSRADEYAV